MTLEKLLPSVEKQSNKTTNQATGRLNVLQFGAQKTFNIIFGIEDEETDKLLHEGRETEAQRGCQESEEQLSCTEIF